MSTTRKSVLITVNEKNVGSSNEEKAMMLCQISGDSTGCEVVKLFDGTIYEDATE